MALPQSVVTVGDAVAVACTVACGDCVVQEGRVYGLRPRGG